MLTATARLVAQGETVDTTTSAGTPIDPSPEAIDALLDIWPISDAFQLSHVSKGLLLE